MVNLIPKRKKKISKEQKFLGYFLGFLIVSLTVTYIAIISFKNKAQSKLNEVEEQIASQKTEELASLESKVKSYKIKVDNFAPYLESHIIATKAFQFFEDNTHPRIYFSQADLKLAGGKIGLSGEANSFLSLGQQLIIFQNHSQVEDISLKSISLGETGNVKFKLDMTLKEDLFKY